MSIKRAGARQQAMDRSANSTTDLMGLNFDMLHVPPPQKAIDFIPIHPLATPGADQGEAKHARHGSCLFTTERG